MARSDRVTILLSVAALCTTIIGASCSTNARIDDLSSSVNARIDDVDTRIDDVNARIDGLSGDIRELRAIVIDALGIDAADASQPAG